ncbi:MAG: cobalamin-independent methionine synthase II family protein [Xanthobacteraceae bacterium]
MQRSTRRILTTHVGSLIRPPELVALLKAKQNGEAIDEAAFDTALQKAIAQIVRAQVDIGLDVVNDGEFGKSISWSRYVLERVRGFEHRARDRNDRSFARSTYGKDRRDFADFYRDYDIAQGFTSMNDWAVTGPISYQGQAAIRRDIAALKQATSGVAAEDVFMCAVAPSSVALDRIDEYYKREEDYLYAIAEALREEYKAIVAAGFVLQVDDAFIATYYDVIVPPGTLEDYRRWAELRVDVLNHALAGIPEERTRYHVCWGSWNGPHVSDVGLKDIVDLILRVRVGGYSIEMANPRHEHEWRVWESTKLPAGKVLLPGLISHSTNVVEHPELVAERITRLAKLVGRENVIASTDCGFAQGPFVQRVHPSIMWAKLRALTEGARIASRELWGRAAAG